MSTICVIGSNSECVAFVLDKPHWILFNPLSPKSDQHEISPCNNNAL